VVFIHCMVQLWSSCAVWTLYVCSVILCGVPTWRAWRQWCLECSSACPCAAYLLVADNVFVSLSWFRSPADCCMLTPVLPAPLAVL
jgi:hypothetical protein